MTSMEMPHYGMVYKGWLETAKPTVIVDDMRGDMVIIHSIEPYS